MPGRRVRVSFACMEIIGRYIIRGRPAIMYRISCARKAVFKRERECDERIVVIIVSKCNNYCNFIRRTNDRYGTFRS